MTSVCTSSVDRIRELGIGGASCPFRNHASRISARARGADEEGGEAGSSSTALATCQRAWWHQTISRCPIPVQHLSMPEEKIVFRKMSFELDSGRIHDSEGTIISVAPPQIETIGVGSEVRCL